MICNQQTCDEPGAYRFTWPGQSEDHICAGHVGKLLGVAQMMGFYLEVTPLETTSEPDEE